MDTIQKYAGHSQQGELSPFQEPAGVSDSSGAPLIKPILRRWRIILFVVLLISLVGVPVVWLTVKPYYQASGAIRITPVIPNILVGGDEVMPMYKNFKATQAALITSDEVLQRVVDTLIEQDSGFFESLSDSKSLKEKITGSHSVTPLGILRDALSGGDFQVEPEDNTELMKVSMQSAEPDKAERIVNAFMRAYMAVVVSKETEGENQKLTILEDEQKMLLAKINRQKQEIRDLAEEYGTASLTTRQDIKFQRVAALRSKQTEFETQRITLQVKAELLQQKQGTTIEPENMVKLRHDFVNADLMVQTLSSNIAQLEQDMIVTRQRLVPGNPEIERKNNLLEAMKTRLETRRQEVGEKFNEIIVQEYSKNSEGQLEQIKVELEQIANYEKHLQDLISQEDSETIKLGHKQLAMEDLQDQLRLTKEMYDAVRRRIQELEMERKRPARISEAYYAHNEKIKDDRVKFTGAVIFGAMASGFGLAFLLNRFDRSLHTPDDVSRSTSIRILGTTTNLSRVKKSLAPSQIADDYLTICANLRLACNGKIPQKISISSARTREGKTTLAINLATSIAKTGKRVLLIDGDLRKTELSRLLKISNGSKQLNERIWKDDFETLITSTKLSEMDVLPASPHESGDIYKLLSQQRTADIVEKLTMKYDHIIIDTPPIMYFSDALLWAKITETVLLTSFSGFTTGSDLTECVDRLSQIKAHVVGVVLNNVRVYDSYGYGNYATDVSERERSRSAGSLLLASEQNIDS